MAVATIPTVEEIITSRSIGNNWTAARWEELPHDADIRYEVIEGVLYMSASPSLLHQRVLGLLYTALFQRLDVPGAAYVFFAPTGVFMPGCDPVQPDLVVTRREGVNIGTDTRYHGIPALLVEILSPSNDEYDLVVKREAYARAGVPEYWIVRPRERDVLMYADPDTATGQYGRTAPVPPDGELAALTLPFRAPLAAFFADAPDATP